MLRSSLILVPNHQPCSFLRSVSHISYRRPKHFWKDWSTVTRAESRKRNYLHVYIQSYPEFENVVDHYVIQGVARKVSFDISDYVTAPWCLILEAVIANNRNLCRNDKIVNPRPDHFPRPVVRCHSIKEIYNVWKAIGPVIWRAELYGRPDYSDAKNANFCETMDECLQDNDILNHDHHPYWY